MTGIRVTRLNAILASVFLIIVVIVLVTIVILRTGEKVAASADTTPDLSDHPIYSSYNFRPGSEIIDVGIQPLWVPPNVIAETMRRDVVMMKALVEQGLELRFHPFLKGADVNFFLNRGDLEVAIGGDMPALTAAADSNAVILSLIQYGFCSIVARQPMLFGELRGKRIGYGFGSNAHYALLQALSSAGLTEADVHLVSLDVNEMPDALSRGDIDAFAAWEPAPSIALARFQDQVIVHRSLCSGYLYVSRSFMDLYPEAVRELVASEIRALNWMNQKDENIFEASQWALSAGQDFSGQTPVLDSVQYAALVKNDLVGMSSVAAIPEKDLAPGGRLFREFEFLQRLGKIPDTVDWKDVRLGFDPGIHEWVLSEAEKYKLDTYDYGSDR